jgi:hypothetical protein
MILRLLSSLSLAVALAAPAAASVVTEADGQFSKHWHSPTVIGLGVDTILGTAEKQNGHEFLALTGLAAGAQTLSFAFTAPASALTSDSYSAGGQVYWSASAFRHAWDGTGAGSFQLGRWTPEAALELLLGDDFAGTLYLGIYFTHGRDVSWSLSAPGPVRAAEPGEGAAVVPLNAAAGYSFAGFSMLAALGFWGGSQRRSAAGRAGGRAGFPNHV